MTSTFKHDPRGNECARSKSGLGSGDDAYYDFRLGIDEGLSKTCITIPIARSGQTYSWNDVFAFTYGCNDTSMRKSLTELIKKKYPPNEPSSRFGGVCKYQHGVITSHE